MADFNELEKKYEKIPQDLKQLRRWVCYKLVNRDGKITKIPLDPHTGNGAKSNDENTWADYKDALKSCALNGYDGLGFQLGNGIFGVDLDNHPDENSETKSQEAFQSLANEFVKTLDSYTEWSQSGNGIHIICYGQLPAGRRRKGNVEMYESNRFFAMTGKSIGKRPIQERTEEVKPLWVKYVDDSEEVARRRAEAEASQKKYLEKIQNQGNYELGRLTDDEVIEKASSSKKSGSKFIKLFSGDLSDFDGDHSKADQSLCNMLAFYTNCNEDQMDRIFRQSRLMREKWDSKRGDATYGELAIRNAIDSCTAQFLVKTKEEPVLSGSAVETEQEPIEPTETAEKPLKKPTVMNIDENGEPIFRLPENRPTKKEYPLDDTGNAERFYDNFGTHFHYNATDKVFMFWTGKTWVYDSKGIIRKYANQLIVMLKQEISSIDSQINECGSDDIRKKLEKKKDAQEKNITRISNMQGKNAMLNELSAIGKMAVENNQFNKSPYLLNTESGVVNLKTGEVESYDRDLMLSNNTNVKVSFEEPTVWLSFLRSIFERNNPEETEQIIECLRRCLGYTLTGLVDEQVMFLLHGGGSNGKSTLATVLQAIMGDYYKSIDSSQLMVQKNQSVSVQYSLAELIGCRYLVTQETDVGAKLSESIIKQITGGDPINAQKKYGKPFQFNPTFKVWMMTNNLPIIRGTDYGIWRRIFLFPFKKQFKDNEKDKSMPMKLANEYDKILGWCIMGAVDYLKDHSLHQPQCLKEELNCYQNDMDVISKFINSECCIDKTREVTKNQMYQTFKNWSNNNNEYAMPESKFREEMVKKGFAIITNTVSGTKSYKGICLNSDAPKATTFTPVNPLEGIF